MRIRMLTGISGLDFNLVPKEETDRFSDGEAQRLIDSGQAELVPVTLSLDRPAKPPAQPAPKPKKGAKA
jgi:hypothetical protein